MTEVFLNHLHYARVQIEKRKNTASKHMVELQESEETSAEEDAIFNERHGEYYALAYCEDLLVGLINCANIEMGHT